MRGWFQFAAGNMFVQLDTLTIETFPANITGLIRKIAIALNISLKTLHIQRRCNQYGSKLDHFKAYVQYSKDIYGNSNIVGPILNIISHHILTPRINALLAKCLLHFDLYFARHKDDFRMESPRICPSNSQYMRMCVLTTTNFPLLKQNKTISHGNSYSESQGEIK